MNRFVYADNSATTKVAPEVLDAMLPFLKEGYGNPSSVYSKGREAKAAIEHAREQVAAAIGCNPDEVYFTSCGSEADNWALKGTVSKLRAKGKTHIVTTVFEHHAILHTCQYLEGLGCDVTYLPVNAKGLVDPQAVKAAIREDTALVSIMYANNEIGTIQPIAEIGAICKEAGVLFHTDAVQAVGNVPIDVKAQHIDMLSLSGHKIHAPKGVGVLYIRKGIGIDNFMHGGAQERKRRAGTEAVPNIVALGKACELITKDLPGRTQKLTAMRDKLMAEILKLPKTRLNGDAVKRLPGSVNFSFEGIEGESLLLMLDMKGICASSGSACTSGSLDPSHVLLAIGLPHEVAHGSLRLSLSDENTMEDVDYIIETLPKIVERLREMSPVWEKIKDE